MPKNVFEVSTNQTVIQHSSIELEDDSFQVKNIGHDGHQVCHFQA